ncbi:MAG: ABC transporter ATP-binding protein [Peptococcaceae bacterium]|jgi:zinc transport system ATP-binding protein|nr:ABC transporter ATP-binding protein [Peptococcaceae bacterium]
MSGIVRVDNLSFQYGDEPIFSQIGFSVYPGESVAVIGSNGAGKSTLLRLILGELTPLTGSVRLFGQEVRHFREWTKIGYLAQNGTQAVSGFPATAEEIVTANLYSRIGFRPFPKKEHREKARTALRQVGMEDYAKRIVGALSGGQQQRVMLARVLVSDPELLFLDEPTVGVDAETVMSLFDLLTRLNRENGLTVVMITHDLARASERMSRVLCLEDGTLVELDKAQIDKELTHKHKHPGV